VHQFLKRDRNVLKHLACDSGYGRIDSYFGNGGPMCEQ
jgi:hypothetical protein